MADTIKNLDGVKTWLQPVKPGDVVGVSSAMFDAPMVNELLDMLPDTSTIEVTVSEVVPDGDSPSLTGTATVLGQPLTTTIFTFTQPAEVLLLDLNLNLPDDVTWQLIETFNIGFTKLKGTMAPDAEQSVITLGFACDVVAGSPKPVHLPVEMAIPTFDGDWTLSGSFDQIGDLSYDILDALAGNNEITSILPDQIRVQINKFSIKEFQLSFNPSNQTCAFIRIVLKYDADWHFFGNLFVVENIEFEYEVFNPFTTDNYYQATLLANMNLFEGFPFQVGGQFPDKVVFAQLQPDRPAELSKIFNFLKIPLPGGFPDIEISTLSLVYYTADGGYDFKLAIDKPIPIAGKVSLDSASFEMGANYNEDTDKMIGFGSLYAKFTISETVVLLSAVYKEGEGVDMTGEVDNLPIGELIAELLITFGIKDYPKFIEGIKLNKLKVTYNTSSGDFTFLCIGHIPMADNPGVDIEVSLKALKSGNDYDTKIEAMGKVTYKLQEYTLLFTKSNTETSFAAQWLNKGTPLGINAIADMLGMGDEVPQIPPDLDLALEAAAFVYDKAESQPLFVLEAASANYGSAAFAAIKDKTTQKWIFYFGMATDAVIDLSNLPIIDKLTFISEGILAVQAIHVDIASGEISKENATTINGIINKYAPGDIKFPNVPAAGMKNLVAFSMQVNIGGTIIPISLGADQGTQLFLQSQRNMIHIGDGYESLYPVVQSTSSDNGGTKNFLVNLEKKFGPLYF